MRKVYHYLFYCFYSFLKKKDNKAIEGAVTLMSMISTGIVFSLYFWIFMTLNRKTMNGPLEMAIAFVISMIVWLINRRYFVKNKNADRVISEFSTNGRWLRIIIGILLLVGQFVLFAYSGISFSFYLKSIS